MNLDSRNSLIRAPPLIIIIAVIKISMLLLCALYITPVGHMTGPDFNLGMMILVLYTSTNRIITVFACDNVFVL